ncbi:hypothetical protein LZ31DRAFT_466767, partial [Colletotrichum somersetense]
ASGNLGSWLLKDLIADDSSVADLSRQQASFHGEITGKVVRFGSLDALAAAIKGHDAFVDCTLTHDDAPK